jgi:hypothetical protein
MLSQLSYRPTKAAAFKCGSAAAHSRVASWWA